MCNLVTPTYSFSSALLARAAWASRSTSRWSRPVAILIFEKFFKGFAVKGKDVYRSHYQAVRSLVPKERLLEYNIKDGWEPLCKFLEQEVPRCSFPNGNEGEATQKLIRELKTREVKLAGGKLAILLAMLLVVYCSWCVACGRYPAVLG